MICETDEFRKSSGQERKAFGCKRFAPASAAAITQSGPGQVAAGRFGATRTIEIMISRPTVATRRPFKLLPSPSVNLEPLLMKHVNGAGAAGATGRGGFWFRAEPILCDSSLSAAADANRSDWSRSWLGRPALIMSLSARLYLLSAGRGFRDTVGRVSNRGAALRKSVAAGRPPSQTGAKRVRRLRELAILSKVESDEQVSPPFKIIDSIDDKRKHFESNKLATALLPSTLCEQLINLFMRCRRRRRLKRYSGLIVLFLGRRQPAERVPVGGQPR